jgi:methylated-DNA-[protein]-cysteine S-methyltransferase
MTTRQHRTHTVIDSPVGPLTLVAVNGTLTGLYLHQQRHRPPEETFGEPESGPFAEATRQLKDYFDGHRTDFDLPLALAGTPFQRRVWTALQDVPYGQTMTYGQLAGEIRQPTAARAVGLANGKNPVSIIVPCHRIIGSTGSLTGYGGGLAVKQYLLAHEQTVLRAAALSPGHDQHPSGSTAPTARLAGAGPGGRRAGP